MTGNIPSTGKQFSDFVKPVDREALKERAKSALGLLGGAYAIVSVLALAWPNAEAPNTTPGNSSVPASSLVTGFARDYVTAYLTAQVGDEDTLARYVSADNIHLPPVAGEFIDTDVAFAKQLSTTSDGVALWTVTVSGIINGNTTAEPQRSYYRVAISVLNSSPRAAALPMQVAGPGVGVDFDLGYSYAVTLDSALGQTASGFVASYLTGGADFTRYVTADSAEKPIQPAPYAKVDTLRIDATVSGDGDGAVTAEVYVTVTASTKNYTRTELAYPLSLRAVEGRWQVVAIPPIPVLKLTPDSPNTTGAPTSTSTTPAPPPERG